MTNAEKQVLIDALQNTPLVLLLGKRFFSARDADNPVYTAIEGVVPEAFYDWWYSSTSSAELRQPSCQLRLEMLWQSRSILTRCVACLGDVPLPVASTRRLVGCCRLAQNGRSLSDSSERRIQTSRHYLFSACLAVRDDRTARNCPDQSWRFESAAAGCARCWTPCLNWSRLAAGYSLRGGSRRRIGCVPGISVKPWSGSETPKCLSLACIAMSRMSLRADEDFKPLIEEGIVLLFEANLAQLVQELAEAGELPRVDAKLLEPDTVVLEVVERSPDKLKPPTAERLKNVTMSQAEWASLNETFSILPAQSGPATSWNNLGSETRLPRVPRTQPGLATGPDI